MPAKLRLSQRIHTANRLTVLVLIISLLLLAVTCFGAWHVRRLQAQSESLLSSNVAGIRATVELEMHLQELRHQLDVYLMQHNWRQQTPIAAADLKLFTSRRRDVELWLRRAEASAFTADERKLIWKVRHGLNAFYAKLNDLTTVAPPSDANQSQIARQAEDIIEHRVLPPARQFLSADEAQLEQSRREAQVQSTRLIRVLMCLGVFGSIAAMIAGYGLARTINRSLVQLRIPMQDVAGKLSEVSGDVVVRTSLDIEDLGPALERVSAQVKSVVEQLHQRHREIMHADQLASVGQLAAGIAHEIRNPLMSMKMLVQAARGQSSAALDGRDLQVLDEEIRRLESLLTEFLDFARPTPLEKSTVDVRTLVENTVGFIQRQADLRRVSLDCELPGVPLLVEADAPRIRQVLVNLLLNGIQATPPGSSVRIQVKPLTADGGCRIVVADQGAGITAEQEPRIFEPFYSTKETGLGLGLAVSSRIIKSHHGDLTLVGGERGGAVFQITLPASPANDVTHPNARHANSSQESAGLAETADHR